MGGQRFYVGKALRPPLRRAAPLVVDNGIVLSRSAANCRRGLCTSSLRHMRTCTLRSTVERYGAIGASDPRPLRSPELEEGISTARSTGWTSRIQRRIYKTRPENL